MNCWDEVVKLFNMWNSKPWRPLKYVLWHFYWYNDTLYSSCLWNLSLFNGSSSRQTVAIAQHFLWNSVLADVRCGCWHCCKWTALSKLSLSLMYKDNCCAFGLKLVFCFVSVSAFANFLHCRKSVRYNSSVIAFYTTCKQKHYIPMFNAWRSCFVIFCPWQLCEELVWCICLSTSFTAFAISLCRPSAALLNEYLNVNVTASSIWHQRI